MMKNKKQVSVGLMSFVLLTLGEWAKSRNKKNGKRTGRNISQDG